MNPHKLDIEKTDHGISFFIDGSLQFNTQDEPVYHESLVIPSAGFAQRVRGALKALVLGGGDGLALREILKFKRFETVDLVDHDPEVLELGRTRFSEWNKNSFQDGRVEVFPRDAVQYLAETQKIYDLIIADLTFPSDLTGARFFSAPFFSAIREHLSLKGVFALNAVSPSLSTPAYWAIFKTLCSLKMHPKPFRIEIPSFISQGYGDWGFFFASRTPFLKREIQSLPIPAQTKYLNKENWLSGLSFPASQARYGLAVSRDILEPSDLFCFLNAPGFRNTSDPRRVDFSRSLSSQGGGALFGVNDFLLDEMAAEWSYRAAIVLESLDWELLLDELEKNLQKTSTKLYEEIRTMRKELSEFFRQKIFNLESAYKFIAALLLIIILVNVVYPDNAFAKGGGFAHGGHGGGNSGDGETSFVMAVPVPRPYFHGALFRSSGLSFSIPDMTGRPHEKRIIRFMARSGVPVHENLFYAVSDFISLSEEGHPYFLMPALRTFYYKMEPDRLVLLRDHKVEPVFEFEPDLEAVQHLSKNLDLQQKTLEKTLKDYEKWMHWAAPAILFTQDDREIKNLKKLRGILDGTATALAGYKAAPGFPFFSSPMARLAMGLYVTREGSLLLRKSDGKWCSYAFHGFPLANGIEPVGYDSALDQFVQNVISIRLADKVTSKEVKNILKRHMASSGAAGAGQ